MHGANVEIYNTIFLKNSGASESVSLFTHRELSQIFAPIPDGETQQSSTRNRSFNTARVGFNYTGIGKSALQLFFALLFSSI
jgi:hypothetical protein